MTIDTSIERLVNGVLSPGFNGTTVPDWLYRAIDRGLGGVVYFAQNVPNIATARALSDALHDARPDLVIASDEEGGDVTRIEAAHGSSLPGNAALGAVDDIDLTERAARALGWTQRTAGVDLDLAPSVDVNANPDNPVIGVRSFGADPELVARHGAAFVAGLQSAGVAACAKHFPGHGDTDVDSHLDLPVLDVDLATLRERDLVPFAATIKAGVRALLTAHLCIPAFGSAPGTLNPAITALARAELGFDGVIVTDALDMQAVARDPGFGVAAVQAVVAGADLLCLGNTAGRDDETDYRVAHDALVAAVESGRLPVGRLEEAADRVRDLTGWLARRPPEGVGDLGVELAAVGREAAFRAVRAVGDVGLTGAPCVADLRRRINHAAGRHAQHLQSELAAAMPGTSFVDPASQADPAGAVAEIVAAAADRPLVVVVREPHREPDEAALLAGLRAERPDLVVVCTGWPHQADELAARVVVAYGAGRASARAAVDLLTRRAEG